MSTQRITSAEELTSFGNAAQEAIQENKDSKKINLSENQKSAFALGVVLLGGSAFVAAQRKEDGTVVEPEASLLDIAGIEETITTGQTQSVPGGRITPSSDIAIATDVVTGQTFNEAFSAARAEVGPGGLFIWNGYVYNTFYQEEWTNMTIDARLSYLDDLGFTVELSQLESDGIYQELELSDDDSNTVLDTEVVQSYSEPVVAPTTENNQTNVEPAAVTTPNSGSTNSSTESTPVVKPTHQIKETLIDGRLAEVHDLNNDGIADIIVTTNEEGQLVGISDESGDNKFDTASVLSPSGEALASATIPTEHQYTLLMDNVVPIDPAIEDPSIIVESDATLIESDNNDSDDNDQNDDYANNIDITEMA